MQAAPPLLPASSSSEVGQAEHDDEQEIPAGGTGASVSMAFVDDAQSDISSDGEPENASISNAASLLRDQDLDLTSVPGLLSYMSMEAATMKALADVLFKIALMLLFAAGLMRTSVPSLLYAAFSVQALYCSRVGLKAIFPSALVVCTAGIAIAMVIIHIVVNQSSAAFSPLLLQLLGSCIMSQTPKRRIYVYFLPDALALLAALILFVAHKLNSDRPASMKVALAARPRVLRALSITDVAVDVRPSGRFAMFLLWACGFIAPMGPCVGVTLIVAYILLRSDPAQPCVSRPVLQFGRFVSFSALLIFWIGQIFVQIGSTWSDTSSASQLLYSDDITRWSWDRDVSFIATALTFVLFAPRFKPLESEGLHARIDSWLIFSVTSKPVLTLLHCVGCFCVCAWAGIGPALLVLPAPFLASIGLIKCTHQQHRIRIASALSCYIVLLQVTHTLAMWVSLAIADSFPIRFDIFFQVGLTSTQISTPVPNRFVYDSSRHVLLLLLGWFSFFIFSIQGAPNPTPQTAIELVVKAQATGIQTAGGSLVSWIGEFSAETLRFCACVVMYFVGLAAIDAIHAVIFLVAVLYKPLIVLLKLVAKSKPRANLWLWSSLAVYTTTVVLFLCRV